MTAWTLRACLITGAAAVSAFSPAVKPPPTAVYVTTTVPAGGHATDEESRGLEDAARELRAAIARQKALRVVDDPAAADVRVEVTNREAREAGEGGYGGIKLTPLGEMIIRFHVKGTEHEADLKGIGPGYWSRAAKDGAERLSRWISNHAAPHKGAPYLL